MLKRRSGENNERANHTEILNVMILEMALQSEMSKSAVLGNGGLNLPKVPNLAIQALELSFDAA